MAISLALPFLAASSVAAVPAVAADAGGDLASRFTLAVLPDTQFYSRYADDQFVPRYGTDPFAVQTEWIVENAPSLNIQFTAHLGDVVDQVSRENEWRTADKAMSKLEAAGLPYSVGPGNHDVLNSDDNHFDTEYDLSAEPYLKWFGVDRAAKQSTYRGSDPTGLSQYHIFEAENQKFMVLALPWRASDATLLWANNVIAENPTVPVILTTHDLLNIASDGVTPAEEINGLRLWDQLIRGNDQIFMTLNGHYHGASRLEKLNDFGHEVTQIVVDYQMAYEGGNGYLSLLEFDLTNKRLNMQTASPWVKFKPQDTLTSYDQLFLDGEHQTFSRDLDFAERFSGFNKEFGTGKSSLPSLTQRARDGLLAGFTGPDPVITERPGNAIDFPTVPGTLAHWRPATAEGTLTENEIVSDIAGDNDLHRVSLNESGSETSKLEDVTVSADTHEFSSAASAVCFANADKREGRHSYLSTASDAAVNNATFNNGYTIETFLKIDPSWTVDANAWSKALVRSGNRSELAGMPWSQWDYTASPSALGISSLREFQWTEVPTETSRGDRTAWSGEILVGRWAHVALVNDPATRSTTMYVDGAPVLRNATDTLGASFNADMPWIIGADWVDNVAGNGWNGCVGETRIIDHPVGPAQWLTARADLSTLSVDAPEGELEPGAVVSSIAGSGLPGAEVRMGGGLDARAAVDDSGEWVVTFSEPLTAGSYEAAVTQSLGDRVSDAIPVSFTILGLPAGPDPQLPGGPGTGGGEPGSGLGGGSDTGLARTGVDLASGLSLAALMMLVTGLGVIALSRARTTSRTRR